MSDTAIRHRKRRIISDFSGTRVLTDGRDLVSFCSNDYLGLAQDEHLKQVFQDAITRYGIGAASSQYICGYTEAHEELEITAASITGYERALYFSSGYMANLAVQTAFLGRNDHVYIDRLSHASIYDAAVLSRARLHRYAHAAKDDLDKRLQNAEGGQKMIVTDGVFSMDGDMAPLREISALSKQHGALLAVDDAHGFAVVTDQGAGSLSRLGLDAGTADIYLVTLGKACGVCGAVVAGSREIIEHLVQRSRTLIYTTALPPALAVVTRAAMLKAVGANDRRERLAGHVQQFRDGAQNKGLDLLPSVTPIQPLMAGDDANALRISDALFVDGYLVQAIRPPTVPEGTSRLRITLSAAHTAEQIDGLVQSLARHV